MRLRLLWSRVTFLFCSLVFLRIAEAQTSNVPSGNCHVTDGGFTSCPNGQAEWSDVQPLAFPATNSFLYVNQDSAHAFLWLMYDFPFRTAPLATTDSVHVSFDTVSQDSGVPGLEQYDIYIFANGQMQVLEQGQPTPAGRIVGAAGFGTSPNSATPHLMAELQVPLTPGPPTDYSPDPLFWSATVPPTPPPPPDPPSCPVTVLGVCVKSQDQIDAWTQEAEAALEEADADYATGLKACGQFGQQVQAGADQLAQAALANATSQLNAQYAAVAAAVNGAIALINKIPPPNGGPSIISILSANVPNAPLYIAQLSSAAENLVAAAPTYNLQLYVTVNLQALLLNRAAVGAALAALDGAVATAGAASALVASELAPLAAYLATVVAVYDGVLVAEAAFASAIQAVAQAVATDACLVALNLAVAPEYAEAAYYELLAEDPADSNFTVIATPVVPSLPAITTASGFSQQVVNDLNALISNSEQEIALLQVIPTSVNRVAGAVAAGNQVWQQKQAEAVQQYSSELIPLLSNEASLRATLASDLTASGVVFTFTSNTVFNFLGPLQNGLPAGITATLTQLGVNAATQAVVLSLAQSTSSQAVAALGSGAFPQALLDPSLAAAANTAIGALTTLAAAPPASSLTQSLSIAIPGDYVASGIGLRGQTGGSIVISGVPTGATVVKALLYWGMLDNGEDAGLKQMTFNGTAIVGTRIGIGPDTCWGRTNSFTYRADVTPLVSGNETYVLTGVATGGNILAEGASLIVIYQLAGAQSKTVMISDGNLSMPLGTSTGTASFGGFAATAPVSATTTFMVGDGQVGSTPVTFTGSLGKLSFPDLFTSMEGPYWDTDSFTVSSVVGAGSSADLARRADSVKVSSVAGGGSSSDFATITVNGDCLLWSAQAFSVTTAPVSSTPVIATAAVVQASATGNTVVNGQGLAPTDAPTLQEQIQMIVQSEIIQNPSISATQLTTQLVDSLPSSILSPGQGAAIINAVVGSLTPAPLTSGEISTTASGLAYSRVTQTFNGTVTIQNLTGAPIPGPLQLVFSALTPGVTLSNATGQYHGNPYMSVGSSPGIAAGQSATVSVQFKNPSNATINFTPVIYSGGLSLN